MTALKAIDVEHELPPAATPIEITGDAVPGGGAGPGGRGAGEGAGPRRDDAAREPLGAARDRRRSSCPRRGSTASAPSCRPGAGQRWLADGCRKAVVCPGEGDGLAADPEPGVRRRAPHARPDPRRRRDARAGADREEEERSRRTTWPRCAARLRPGPGRAGDARPGARRRCASCASSAASLLAALCGDRVPIEETPTALCPPRWRAATTTGAAPGQPPDQPSAAGRSRRSARRSCPRSHPRRRPTPGG